MRSVPLREIASTITKGTTPTTLGFQYTDAGVPFLRAEDVQNGPVLPELAELRIDQSAHQAMRRSWIHSGDVLITIAGTVGRVGVVESSPAVANCNQAVCLVRLELTRAHPKFVMYALLGGLGLASTKRGATTATISNLSLGQIGDTLIPLPPLEEQRRIAAVLDRSARLVKLHREAAAKTRDLIPALFIDMFGDPATNPMGWEVKPFEEIGAVQLGRQRAPKYQSGRFTTPYVRVANVFEDEIDVSDLLRMDFNPADFAKYKLKYGDILLNEGQSIELVGRPAMWRDEVAECCFQNTLVRFQANPSQMKAEFALASILWMYRSGVFNRVASKTSNVAHLGAGRFAALKTIVPPLSRQSSFSKQAEMIESIKASAAARTQAAEELHRSLLAEVFGEA